MKIKILLFVHLAVALTLTACGVGGAASSAASPEGEWTLLTLNGVPLLAGSAINATFMDEKVTGYSGCNSYGGAYTVKGDALELGEIAMTLMACLEDGGWVGASLYESAVERGEIPPGQ